MINHLVLEQCPGGDDIEDGPIDAAEEEAGILDGEEVSPEQGAHQARGRVIREVIEQQHIVQKPRQSSIVCMHCLL